MFILFWCILVLSSLDVVLVTNAKEKEKAKVLGDPNFDYNAIVRDMIRSWEAPVVYLRSRGILPSDYQDTSKIKPSLDALMQRLDKDKREARNHLDEWTLPRKVKGVSKERKCFGWEQLQALGSKFRGNRSKPDDREKLLAMKRLMDQLQPEAHSSQLPDIQMHVDPTLKPKESSTPKYDDTLERLIEKTSPRKDSGRQPFFSDLTPKAPALPDIKPGTSAPKITMPKFSPPESLEGNYKQSAPKLKPGLEAPTFLNWNIKTGRFDNYSASEEDAYLNKVLKAYQPQLEFGETRNASRTQNSSKTQDSSENRTGAADLTHFISQNLGNSSMSHGSYGVRANAH